MLTTAFRGRLRVSWLDPSGEWMRVLDRSGLGSMGPLHGVSQACSGWLQSTVRGREGRIRWSDACLDWIGRRAARRVSRRGDARRRADPSGARARRGATPGPLDQGDPSEVHSSMLGRSLSVEQGHATAPAVVARARSRDQVSASAESFTSRSSAPSSSIAAVTRGCSATPRRAASSLAFFSAPST